MKKLIALVTLLFAFTINANAQDRKKEVSIEEAAKNDIIALNQVLKLNDQQQADFLTLMTMKHEELRSGKLSDADKKGMAQKIERKIVSAFDEVQRKELNQHPALMKRLTSQ